METEPTPTTSVLIVSYNCEAALRRCLEAIENSDERETFEVLVVDCASRDSSGGMDAEFPNVTVLRLPRNLGRTKARNIGARTAKGKFLALLEPHVDVLPATLPALVARLEQDEETLAVCPCLVDADGSPISRSGPLPEPAVLYGAWTQSADWTRASLQPTVPDREAMEVECPDPALVVVRARAVKGMNYFDERYGEFGSDLELYTQAYRASKKILILRDIKAVARGRDGSWSPSSSAARTCLAADFGNGIVAYVQKYYGWGAGLRMRLKMLLWALTSLRLGLLSQLLAGQKVDGSQGAL